MKISPQGLDFIKGFESFVPHVYDDKRAPVKGKYREWKGEAVRGTLTIGYGHTNSAKHPLKIKKGLKISEKEACEILDVDLDECEGDVNELGVELTQGQFDALTSFTFNCGGGNLRKLATPLTNRGDYDATRARFDLYIYSKGTKMRGLQRRRDGEQVLWDSETPEVPAKPVHHPEQVDEPIEAPPRPVTPEDLVPVSRKARRTAWIKRGAHTIWMSLGFDQIMAWSGIAQETRRQVELFVSDHAVVLAVTLAILAVVAVKGIEALMAEDVNEGRAVPSGGLPKA